MVSLSDWCKLMFFWGGMNLNQKSCSGAVSHHDAAFTILQKYKFILISSRCNKIRMIYRNEINSFGTASHWALGR